MPSHYRHIIEFSKRSKSYQKSNIIQKEVAKYLVSRIDSNPKHIIDLGAGSGAVYRHIDWNIEHFVAVDLSTELLKLHPKSNFITTIIGDFDDKNLYQDLKGFDFCIASSSLQWSRDLNNTLNMISNSSKEVAFAIFCDKTFKTIREIAGIDTFLQPSSKVLKDIKRFFDVDSKVLEYHLEFQDKQSIFRYIKDSGVSGGKRILDFKSAKNLIKNYPLNYLEFEVLFVWGKSQFFSERSLSEN